MFKLHACLQYSFFKWICKVYLLEYTFMSQIIIHMYIPVYTYTINDNHAISEILLMMLAQRLIKQDRNLVSWMHSELNYPQVSLVYYMIHLNLLTIKSCSVIHCTVVYMYGGLTFHSNAFFFLAVLFELNRVTTSQAKQYLIICRDKFMKSQIEPGTGTRSLIQV